MTDLTPAVCPAYIRKEAPRLATGLVCCAGSAARRLQVALQQPIAITCTAALHRR